MARKTFGRDGRSITVVDATVGSVAGESEFIVVGSEVGSVADEAGSVDDSIATIEPPTGVGPGVEDSGTRSEDRFVDPATVAPRTKRKYTRRSPGASKNAPQAIAFATANLEKVLMNLHLMGSAMLAEPELIIDQDEAKLLADAIAEVARAYDFTAVLSAKAQAGIDMAIALATVYGGRALRVMARQKKPRATVVNIQQPQQTQPVNIHAAQVPGVN